MPCVRERVEPQINCRAQLKQCEIKAFVPLSCSKAGGWKSKNMGNCRAFERLSRAEVERENQ